MRRYFCPWHSWIARQTPTLKAAGSNPVGQARKKHLQCKCFFSGTDSLRGCKIWTRNTRCRFLFYPRHGEFRKIRIFGSADHRFVFIKCGKAFKFFFCK